MLEIKIDISELKNEGSDLIKELASFLREKTGAKVKTETNWIIIKDEKGIVARKYLRVLLRKFLYRKEFKDFFRVIGSKGNTLVVKEKKISEED